MKMSELRKLVRQVIQEAGVSAGVAGHSGAHGNDIDDYSAGPFKPDGNVTIPLRHQVDSSKEKRKSIIPQPEQTWDDIDTNLEYDKVPDYAGSIFVNDTNDFKIIDWAYEFDIVDTPKDSEGLTNDTNEYKIFGEGVSNEKELIDEVSTTIGGTGHADAVRHLTAKMDNAGENMADADSAYADATQSNREAQKNWKQHVNSEPDETTTVTQNVTTYPSEPDATHIYYDPANHPGVISPGGATVYANKNIAPATNLISFRTVLDAVSGNAADQSLRAFDNHYGTQIILARPNVYLADGSAFATKLSNQISKAMEAGGSVVVRSDGVRVGKTADFISANRFLMPLKNNKSESASWLQFSKAQAYKPTNKPNILNIQYFAWRMSLGSQNPPTITFSNTSKVQNDAWQQDALGTGAGQAKIVNAKINQVTKTVENPAWADWNTQLEELENLKDQMENSERNARATLAQRKVGFEAAKQEVENIRKERDLAFKGMGGRKSMSGKGNIARGSGGKGRTLKGRRSKTAGGGRGGVPSLAALSGMKAVKGKGKGTGKKGKKGKDEE